MKYQDLAPNKIVQIHPTRHCNLACLHCYSESSPEQTESLNPALVCEFLSDMKKQGYAVASFSGGEPLIYPGLKSVLEHAKNLGLSTSVVSNGILLTKNKLRELDGLIDTLAISVDGTPERHNKIRNSPKAFQRMSNNLRNLAGSNINLGFIHTLSDKSFEDIRWITDFCLEHKASLLQLHPLEKIGWTTDEFGKQVPNNEFCTRFFLFTFLLQQKHGGRIRFQIDLMNSSTLQKHPELVFAQKEFEFKGQTLGELVNPIILEPSGDVLPMCYGFGRSCNPPLK
ncbi:MAG: radical SAM protein [Nitrospina sp.]|nr:radical SAM protein [Nitrospina sp.]